MVNERKTPELDAWRGLLEDRDYRSGSPDAWHQALLSAAEELLRNGVIDWDDWLKLKDQANAAYEQAIKEAVARRRDDPQA
ncbi:hypothetical protein SAMN03159453_04873 [Pseudomonas sp. NFIX28]|nr:hypothetical protein [Pseudomonas sp. NFIX28]SDZ59403.1 hypothetical protein SAMN03159453_04873 [Pseudomonas sp. NFIX28]